MDLCFTNGTCLESYPAITDQNGGGIWAPGTGNWQYRRIDLSPAAGMTIQQAYLGAVPNTSSGTWHAYYDDLVVEGADGTHPLYTRESSANISLYGPGETNSTATVETSTATADVTNAAQTTYYYHGDQIGSSRLMTSGGGWPVWQGTFLPYGEEYNAQIGTYNAQMNTNHYKFTGKERDTETQLDYFGARYYGNALGRFLTPDWASKPTAVPYASFGNPQSLNLYSYEGNNPVSGADTDGHCWPICQVIEIVKGIVRDGGAGPYVKNNVIGGGKGLGALGVKAFRAATAPNLHSAIASQAMPLPKAVTPSNLTQAQASLTTQTLAPLALGPAIGAIEGASMGLETTTFFHYGFAADEANFASGLRAGSFATTDGGLTGADAQSTLALGHETVPDAVYPVTPEPGTPMNGPSTVQPANGQPGGGQEVTFPQGTGPGTVGPPKPIPPQ
jgi:RHS repeat-associated protein